MPSDPIPTPVRPDAPPAGPAVRTHPARAVAKVATVLIVGGGSLWAGQTIRGAVQRASDAGPPNASPSLPFDLTDLRVDREHVRMAGPSKDGIPAIDSPRVIPITGHQPDPRIQDQRVVSVTIDGETRGYPLWILRWHEVANDTLGGEPISVIYCPLCDSVSVVERDLSRWRGPTSFGVSGQLLDSNVLMYDRAADGLWSQVAGMAISGPRSGERLRHRVGWSIESLADLHERVPGATMLGVPDPPLRPYHVNPYEGESTTSDLRFRIRRDDQRLPRKTPVIGIAHGGASIALELSAVVASGGRMRAAVPGGEILVEVIAAETAPGADALPPDQAFRRITVLEAPEDAVVVHTWWFAWASQHPETQLVSP